jgi:hypothetical protein
MAANNPIKDEKHAAKLPSEGDAGQQAGQNNRRGNRRTRNRWNNTAGAGGSAGQANNSAKFPTRNKELPENAVFDNTGQVDAANFQRSLKAMANYLHTTYSAEVSTAILTMQDVTIIVEEEPVLKKDPTTNQPIPLTSWEEYKWKKTYTEQSNKLKVYIDSMPKAFIHIHNQCSTNLKNDLEASNVFPTVKANKDPIGLLKLIQGLCCSYDSKTQSVMATVASQKKLFTFFQRDGMDNSTYHHKFVAHVETIETYGGSGAIGITPTFVAQKLQDMQKLGTCQDADNPTKPELATAHKAVRDEFLAALMLSGANCDRYGALRNELANQYGFGNDLYPKSIDQCLTMMNRWVDSAQPRQQRAHTSREPKQEQEEALVFAQNSDKPSRTKQPPSPAKSSSSSSSGSRSGRITTVVCKLCGQQGHVSAVCPRKNPPEQIHAITNDHDDASASSDDDSVLILAQIHAPFARPRTKETDDIILTQPTSPAVRHPIASDLVLLDSQSTVHLFCQPEHVDNIRPAAHPIRVHCNKGTLETTQEATFGDTPVYFDPRGIANVLSLYQLGQKFWVADDSTDRGGVFKVFTKAGIVEFPPTPKGLHAMNIQHNPEAAYLLVNNADSSPTSPIQTIRKN